MLKRVQHDNEGVLSMTHSDNGFFDTFGGKYVAEVLRRPLDELEAAFNKAIKDPLFIKELETIQRDYIGR